MFDLKIGLKTLGDGVRRIRNKYGINTRFSKFHTSLRTSVEGDKVIKKLGDGLEVVTEAVSPKSYKTTLRANDVLGSQDLMFSTTTKKNNFCGKIFINLKEQIKRIREKNLKTGKTISKYEKNFESSLIDIIKDCYNIIRNRK